MTISFMYLAATMADERLSYLQARTVQNAEKLTKSKKCKEENTKNTKKYFFCKKKKLNFFFKKKIKKKKFGPIFFLGEGGIGPR